MIGEALQIGLGDAQGWLREAIDVLYKAQVAWGDGNLEKAQHLVAEAEDLLDDVDRTLTTAVGP